MFLNIHGLNLFAPKTTNDIVLKINMLRNILKTPQA